MAKIQITSNKTTAFAGNFYVHELFMKSGLYHLVNKELGDRKSTKKYSYGNVFSNFFNLFISGGECAEDIQTHYRKSLEQIPFNKVASADVLLRTLTELSEENIQVKSSAGNIYNFNLASKMNSLNIKSLFLTKQLSANKWYDLDYDNQIIEHNKIDAKRTYKKNSGYFPGIASIGNKIVYIENRDGNASVKIGQSETLNRCYKMLSDNKIKINRSRMDAGSYSEDIIKTVAENSKLFYVRSNKSEALEQKIREVDEWIEVEINHIKYQVCSIPFTNFLSENNYRLVVSREKSNDLQGDLFEKEGIKFIYRTILTNDHKSSEKEVIIYYNQRGAIEKNFDVLNNDFGWKHLPKSFMPANTVYMLLTAMMKNFYIFLVEKVSEVFEDIPANSRLKRFIFRFITVPGRWIYKGRQWWLQLYTDKPYDKLIC